MEKERTIDEVINALDCFKTRQPKCDECVFNPTPGHIWPYGCIRGQGDIADEAQRILRRVADGIQDV